ncbi:MAG TPA: BMP family ABC transporter substrate-binding protein, partial [Roseiarcus sp.]|nr:BMP family ABC transporter substrate-binding protein [Roseiarcus sp.]
MSARLSRRTLIKTSALGLAGATLNIGAFGRAFAAKDLTIGIVYVGARDDFGWNQAHAVAVKALKEVPGVKVVEEENVPETDAVSKSMESMINLDGAGLLLATSFGYYTPFVVDLAKKYPDVEFRHAAPLWNKDKDPKNAGSYFGYLNQGHYVNGVAAGLCTKKNKIGFVAAKPIASVLSNINSVLLGARSTNPNATVQVIFTGDWSLPVREAEAVNALVDAGCDVITCHVDSPKVVIETAEKRGVKCCGHNASQAPLAPKGFITGAEYKWETVYKGYAADLAAGKPLPNVVTGGYESDMVQNTPFGAGADESARKAATKAIADLKNKMPIYVGPLKDNKG